MDQGIITTSWDDGHPLDFKLAELLKKYDIPASFYIPINYMGRECMNSQQIKEIAQSFDVGGHTYHHVNLTRVSLKEAEKEIVEGKKRLEEIVGKKVISFCYPYGGFNHKIIDIVKGVEFIGARTVRLLTRSIKDPFKMGTTIYARDLCFAPYVKYSVAWQDLKLFRFMLKNNLFFKAWDQIAIKTLDFVIQNGGVWHLWGHSWEIDGNNDWARLEEVLRRISMLSKEAGKLNNSQLLNRNMGREGLIAPTP